MASGARSRGFIDLQLIGGRELIAALGRLEREGMRQEVIGPGLQESGELVEAAVRSRVPVLTGALKSTLRLKVSKTRARVIVGSGGKGGQFHGPFLEFGTRKMPARPFMRPALDENRRRIEAIFARLLKAAVGRVAESVNAKSGKGRWSRSKVA